MDEYDNLIENKMKQLLHHGPIKHYLNMELIEFFDI